MIPKNKSIFLLFTSLIALVYGVSLVVNQFFNFSIKWAQANNNFNQVFLFFAITSTILFIIHYIVYKKNKEQLGFVFLATLTLKVATCFFFINEITNVFEKYYTFTYFFVFLIIDVLQVVILLNKKQ